MDVKLVKSKTELDEVCRIFLDFRPNYSKKQLLAQIKKQQDKGYQIAYVRHEGKIVTVAGFVVGYKLAWGKHIYIDDLVTAEGHRSIGAGKFIIDWFKSYAKGQGCGQIHLDSSVVRFQAHRFYLREGFNIKSHHFSIIDIGDL